MDGKLFLIPNTLGDSKHSLVFPVINKEIILSLDIFIIEDLRSSRRFLKKNEYPGNFDNVQFILLNEHSKEADSTQELLDLFMTGKNIGLLSDAGMPCLADPGMMAVQLAHQVNYKVIPLIGPSSLFLALAASGLNGQKFAFHGYLPIKQNECSKVIRNLENNAAELNQTQLFIEAPYRNQRMLDIILKTCHPDTQLCIACDITLESEYIKTKAVSSWKTQPPDIHKKPTVFLLSK